MSRVITDTNSTNKILNSRKSKSKQTNPIIYGYFPRKTYKEMAIARVNRTLCAILGMFIIVSFISYYFVTSCEMQMNILSRDTTKLNNENVELQNKLDNMYSFNNVDKVVRRNNMLNTAKQVMEVPAAATTVAAKAKSPDVDNSNAYQWSIGY